MRLAKSAALVLGCTATLSFAAAALAGVPSPANSSLPACVTLCPYGDLSFQVVVRDFAANPVPGSAVDLDFGPCPAVALCPPQAGDTYTVNGRVVRVFTGASGVATFAIRAGGVCDAGSVPIRADGVLLGNRNAASPDQNGNLFVTGIDQTIQAGGAATPGKDLDCDGSRTAADAGILAAHLGHACTGVVGTAARSWGTLKILYR